MISKSERKYGKFENIIESIRENNEILPVKSGKSYEILRRDICDNSNNRTGKISRGERVSRFALTRSFKRILPLFEADSTSVSHPMWNIEYTRYRSDHRLA